MCRWLMLACVGTITLGGCSSRPEALGGAQLQTAASEVAPINVVPEYRMGPRDQVAVAVFGEPELSVDDREVSPTGSLSLPLLGEIPVAGMTVHEVEENITRQLNARYLRSARVTVGVTKAVNYTFTVQGQVQKPGIYPITGRTTLMSAIAAGEGETKDARITDVVVLRQIDGKSYAGRFDLEQIRLARMSDPAIYQSDVIVVGLSRGSRMWSVAGGVLPGFAGILGVFVALSK